MRSNDGASANISLSMPVSSVMPGGTGTPGFTRLCHSKSTRSPVTPMTATSMTRCVPGEQPVVSMSTKATGESAVMFR
jgi:hypothetical protein